MKQLFKFKFMQDCTVHHSIVTTDVAAAIKQLRIVLCQPDFEWPLKLDALGREIFSEHYSFPEPRILPTPPPKFQTLS